MFATVWADNLIRPVPWVDFRADNSDLFGLRVGPRS